MRNWLLICIGVVCFSWVNAHEYYVEANDTELVFKGQYLTEKGNQGKEFWICVDYESSVPINENYGSKYPITGCGGSPATKENMYWYAVHGIWEEDDRLSIRFKCRFQLWPHGSDGDRKSIMSTFLWNLNALEDSNTRFKIVQTHGVTDYGAVRPDIDTLLLLGGGSVHVRGVKAATKLHIRVKNSDETGITLNKVYETKYNTQYDREVYDADQTTGSPFNSEEAVTQPPFNVDSDLIFPDTENKEESDKIEETTDSSKIIDTEPFETTGTLATTEEPHLLIREPEFDEVGRESRPTADIPFIDPTVIVEVPLYDRSSEEARQTKNGQRMFENFDNEISEEEATTIVATTEKTSDEDIKNVIDDTNPLDFTKQYEPFNDLLVQRSDSQSEYGWLYTVSIGVAFGFLCFFILIVLFRFCAWGQTDKVVSLPQKHVVYTIGSEPSSPTKVVTQ